eukprot:m.66380 g.66380  ORF g.66380 m.66380 type:complete len:765 (+) comp11802_c0_seq2:431-2725(+)
MAGFDSLGGMPEDFEEAFRNIEEDAFDENDNEIGARLPVFDEMVAVTMQEGSSFLRQAVEAMAKDPSNYKVTSGNDYKNEVGTPRSQKESVSSILESELMAKTTAKKPKSPKGTTGNVLHWIVELFVPQHTSLGITLAEYRRSRRSLEIDSTDDGKGSGLYEVVSLEPNSPAGKSGKIHVGDILLEVNRTAVSGIHSKLDNFFGELTLLMSYANMPEPEWRLMQILEYDTFFQGTRHSQHPHDVLVISLPAGIELEDQKPQDNVIYQYSKSDRFKGSGIMSLQGGLSTLFLMLEAQVTKDAPNMIKMDINGHTTNVTLRLLGLNHLFVVAASEEICDYPPLDTGVSEMLTILGALYSPLEVAFSDDIHKERMDAMFSIFFQRLALNCSADDRENILSHSLFWAGLPGVPSYDCTPDENLEISDTLGSLETNGANSKLNRDEACITIGSCLFVDGVNIQCNLPSSVFRTVCSVCHGFGLLSITAERKVPTTSHWMEIHNIRRENFSQDGKTYLLITTTETSLFAVVLQGWNSNYVVDEMHMADARLVLHMLRVNGTLKRIARNVLLASNQSKKVRHTVSEPAINTSPTRRSKKWKSVRRSTTDIVPNNRVLCSYFVNTDEGTIKADYKLALFKESTRQQILRQFLEATRHIKGILEQTKPIDRKMSEGNEAMMSKQGPFESTLAPLIPVTEHGIMYTIRNEDNHRPRKISSVSSYSSESESGFDLDIWVVGRHFITSEGNRLAFVCFNDGTPPDMIETAFNLHSC